MPLSNYRPKPKNKMPAPGNRRRKPIPGIKKKRVKPIKRTGAKQMTRSS